MTEQVKETESVHVVGENAPSPDFVHDTVPVGLAELATDAVQEMDCPTTTVVDGEHPVIVVAVDALAAHALPTLPRKMTPKTNSNETANQPVLKRVSLPPTFPS